ncbi:MAG TPA: hypothetical protein VHF22_10810, partial [Planctomycetota bacterium]|nr:hypothetical protein [Planctomycetota bacterium]
AVYVLEQQHPGDFLSRHPRPQTHWKEARDGIEVEARFGREDDPYDPIAQLREATVELRVRRSGVPEEVHVDRLRMKEWTASELDAAICLSGAFDVVERHGEFGLDAPFDATPASWRMISVLRVR